MYIMLQDATETDCFLSEPTLPAPWPIAGRGAFGSQAVERARGIKLSSKIRQLEIKREQGFVSRA